MAYEGRGCTAVFEAPVPSGGSVVYLEGPHGDPGLIELIPATPGMDEMFTRFWQTTTNWTGHDRIRPFGLGSFRRYRLEPEERKRGRERAQGVRRKQHDVLAQERNEQRVRQRRGQEKGAPPGKEDDDGAGGDEKAAALRVSTMRPSDQRVCHAVAETHERSANSTTACGGGAESCANVRSPCADCEPAGAIRSMRVLPSNVGRPSAEFPAPLASAAAPSASTAGSLVRPATAEKQARARIFWSPPRRVRLSSPRVRARRHRSNIVEKITRD